MTQRDERPLRIWFWALGLLFWVAGCEAHLDFPLWDDPHTDAGLDQDLPWWGDGGVVPLDSAVGPAGDARAPERDLDARPPSADAHLLPFDLGLPPRADWGEARLDGGPWAPDFGEAPLDAQLPIDLAPPDPPPCGGGCAQRERCIAQQCVCEAGFQRAASGECEAIPAGDPSLRTQAQVCDRYQESLADAPNYFIPGEGDCHPGALTSEGIGASVRRLNFYRWHVGLGPSSAEDDDLNHRTQQCAMIAAWNPAGQGAHSPPETAQCYTREGAGAAGSSNIAWQTSPVGMIDMFIDDYGNDSTLGHRRWCLSQGLGRVGVGVYRGGNNYGSAGCLYVIGGGGGGSPLPPSGYVAYPPAGYTPVQLATVKIWSLSYGGFGRDLQITVTDAESGEQLPVVEQPLSGNYGAPTVGWKREGWQPQAGKIYRVELSDGQKTISYEVRPVGC